MSTSTLVSPRAGSRHARGLAATLVAAGLAATTLAGVAMTQLGNGAANVVAASDPNSPPSLTVSGPGDITVVSQVYEPGQSSGWHAHPGIHAAAILSGLLTVYDGACRAQTYQPGRPYVGGQELHLVRNETAAPVEMVVTYISPAAPGNSNLHPPAPPCASTMPAAVPGDEING